MAPDWSVENGIATTYVKTAADLVELLRRSNPLWWEGNQIPWVFRGHRDSEWKLLPSAWRQGNEIISAARVEAEKRLLAVGITPELKWRYPPSNFITGEYTFGANDDDLKKRLAIEATAEMLPIWDFFLACEEVGIQTSILNLAPPDPAVSPNWMLVPGLPLIADEYLNFNDIPFVLALAQHHGLPTRLLDWSGNPLAAAFFAIEEIGDDRQGDIAIWALHRNRAQSVVLPGVLFPNGFTGAPPIGSGLAVHRPTIRENSFQAAQSGLFTTFHGAGIYFMQKEGVRPSVDQYVTLAKPTDTVLRKVLLPKSQVAELADILRRERVTRSSFMPTLDNVARDVLRHWSRSRVSGQFSSI